MFSSWCLAVISSLIIPQEVYFHMYVHNNPLGLRAVFDDKEMFEEDLEGDPVEEVFEDDPGFDPVWDSVIIDSFESISSIQESRIGLNGAVGPEGVVVGNKQDVPDAGVNLLESVVGRSASGKIVLRGVKYEKEEAAKVGSSDGVGAA